MRCMRASGGEWWRGVAASVSGGWTHNRLCDVAFARFGLALSSKAPTPSFTSPTRREHLRTLTPSAPILISSSRSSKEITPQLPTEKIDSHGAPKRRELG